MKTKLPLYTPSLLDPSVLEAIFVKRQALLQDLLENHQQSITTDSKHFSLFIGPRGIGKTHLLSLFNHKVQSDPQLADKTVIAWLREEEWGVASYLDLLLQILNSLDANTDELYQFDEQPAAKKAEEQLLDLIGDKTLLLISENMDLIFQGLGADGQHQLRAFIQNSAKITIVAAAQSLFNGVTLRKSPFYGFFRIEHLQPLSVDEAIELLINIARFDNKDDLVTMLQSSKGRVRVRALHHLANGNPRIYVTFSQLIQADSLDQFTDVVLQMLDELTPYYQAKMIQIPAQQRKIVQFLCRQSGTVMVSDIAKFTHLKHQAASSQLKNLKDAGYVKSYTVGRTSHYEIAEPLMRLVLEVKEARKTPVKLMINFIRHWFSAFELQNLIALNQCQVFDKPWLGREFIEQAIDLNKSENFDPLFKSCMDDYIKTLQQGSSKQLMPIVDDLAQLGQTPADIEKADAGKFKDALQSKVDSIFEILRDSTSYDSLVDCCGELTMLKKHHGGELVSGLTMIMYGLTLHRDLTLEQYQQLMQQFPWPERCQLNEEVESFISSCLYHAIFAQIKAQQFEFAQSLYSDFIRLCTQGHYSNLLFSTNSYASLILMLLISTSSTLELFYQQKQPLKALVTNTNTASSWAHYLKFLSYLITITSNKSQTNTVFLEAKDIALKQGLYDGLFEVAQRRYLAALRQSDNSFSYENLLELSDHPQYVECLVGSQLALFNSICETPVNQHQGYIFSIWQKMNTLALKHKLINGLITSAAAFVRTHGSELKIVEQALTAFSQSLNDEDKNLLNPALLVLAALTHYADNDGDKSLLLTLPQEQRALIDQYLNTELPI